MFIWSAILKPEEMKKRATAWYTEISTNEIVSARISSGFSSTVVMRVLNPIDKKIYRVWIKFGANTITHEHSMALCTKIGTHAVRYFYTNKE